MMPTGENLTPFQFKPGQSGNPAGARLHKPKPLTVLDHVYRLLAEENPATGETFAALAAKGIVMGMVKGDSAMAKLVLTYQSGMPGRTSGGGDPIGDALREAYAGLLKPADEATEDVEFTATDDE